MAGSGGAEALCLFYQKSIYLSTGSDAPPCAVATRLEIAGRLREAHGAALGATDSLLRHRVRVGAHSVLSNTGHTEHTRQ